VVGGAVAFVAGWDLRRRARRFVFLVLLVALVGAAVLATVAGARRSGTALERFKASSRSADVELAAQTTPAQIDRLRQLAGVAAVATLPAYGLVIPQDPQFQSIGATVDDQFGHTVDRDRLVAGRRPDPRAVDEVTVGEGLANRLDLGVGDRLRVDSFTPGQIAATLSGVSDVGTPAGPHPELRVVGIVRRPLDLGEEGAPGGLLVLTPAFAHAYAGQIGVFGSRVRIRTDAGAADVPRVLAGARRVLGRSLFVAQGLAVESQGARNAIDVIVLALWIAAAMVALAALVAVGIVVAREASALTGDLDRLRALGATRSQRVLVACARNVVVAVAGGALAVLGALLLSPFFPVGVARRADPDVGFHVDWVVVGVGLVAVVASVLVIAVVAAIRATRPTRADDARARTSTIAERVAGTGASPALSNGVRLALERGRAPLAVPVRSAALGAVLGVLGVVAVLVFGTNLHDLVGSRARYGAPWDFQVVDRTSNTPCGASDYGIPRLVGVASLTEVCVQNVQIAGRPVTALAYTGLKGAPVHATVVDGRAPRGRHEVALGETTLDALGEHVGGTLRVQGRDQTLRYRIVGRAVFPTLGTAQPLADGAAFTGAGYRPIFDQNLFNRFFVGRYSPGVDPAVVDRRLAAVPQVAPPTGPTVPVEIDRLRQIDWLPITLTVLLALFAMLAVGHGLVTSVRHRRRELALLKTLGFARRQVVATVNWQATTLAAVGVVVGVPLGLVVGAVVWHAVADGLSVAPETSVPVAGIVATAVVATLLAVAIAWWPARAAARTRPSIALRSE
jgi:ABC-type lipoprotein release transport system permease subunit